MLSLACCAKLFTVARRKGSEVSLKDHVTRIGALGGEARAANMTDEERSESARQAGLVGGRARAASLTKAQRKAIAQAAAAARWGKPKGRKQNE
jgi:hypothetical protein